MSRTRALLLSLAVLGCGAPTEPSHEAAASAGGADVEAPRQLCLWELTSPEGQVSHILGTYHLGVGLDEALPAPHSRHLDEARTLVLELDFGQIDPIAFAQIMVLPDDEDLETLIGATLFAKLVAAVPDIPAEAWHRMRPWAAMSMVMARGQAEAESERTGDELSLLDMQVHARALEHHIAVRGLETPEEQGELMSSLPLEGVVEFLEHSLDEPDVAATETSARTNAYIDGDLEALEREFFDPEELASAPEVWNALLFDRNARWLPTLEEELRAGRAFVAVGLGHLLGDRGLLILLERDGFTVRRLAR